MTTALLEDPLAGNFITVDRRELPSVSTSPQGATYDGIGTEFKFYSAAAQGVSLCLFKENGREIAQIPLQACQGNFWEAYIPAIEPGQLYAYRVDSKAYGPQKLVLDPFATDLPREAPHIQPQMAQVPQPLTPSPLPHRRDLAADAMIYEGHVVGLTREFAGIPEEDRGTFRGLMNDGLIAHMKSLGVTTLELLPVQAFWAKTGNYWGYDPLGAFGALHPAYGTTQEFAATVAKLKANGIDVVLDVVFNHTADIDFALHDADGKTYYQCYDVSGCGYNLNIDDPQVQELVISSLQHLLDLGVVGFRFDLAPALGHRGEKGYWPNHPLMKKIEALDAILLGEAWTVQGIDQYQLGNLPRRFQEWNDKYRDSVRKFWLTERGIDIGLFADVLSGSNRFLGHDETGRSRSINFITCHDGLPLADLTDSQQQRRNLMATLALSRGTHMLLAGDEIGNSQNHNDNAYNQNNPVGWTNFSKMDEPAAQDFLKFTREVNALRKTFIAAVDSTEAQWLKPDGQPMTGQDWKTDWVHTMTVVKPGLAIFYNGCKDNIICTLPAIEGGGQWLPVLSTDETTRTAGFNAASYAASYAAGAHYAAPGSSVTVFQQMPTLTPA